MSTPFYQSVQESTLAKTLPQSLFLHVLLIFGIGFGIHSTTQTKETTLLDITIVNTHSDKEPEDAELIAQVNQEASGNTDIENRATSIMASQNLEAPNEISPLESEKATPNTPPVFNATLLTTKGETKKSQPKVEEQPVEEDPFKKAEENIDQTAEEKQLASEVAQREANYAKMPRKRFISATSAKSAVEAEYIDRWAKRIERVGTANFPAEALNYKRGGRLTVEVTLDRQGTIVHRVIKKRSEAPFLDKAAMRIIEIAGQPSFDPLPNEVVEKFDQLVITRTFIFDVGDANQGANLTTE